MKDSCAPSPTHKKEYITEIGKILVEENGRKKYYKPEEVKKAHNKSEWYNVLDFSCWAMSIFSSHSDFDHYHLSTGEACDYIGMKSEMLSGLSISAVDDWTEIPDIDLDASWLDFGDVFGGILEGIGDFIGAIFEGL